MSVNIRASENPSSPGQVLELAPVSESDIDNLLSQMEDWAELKCEAPRSSHACTETVVCRFTWCKGAALLCAPAGSSVANQIVLARKDGTLCAECYTPIAAHWKVTEV